MQQQFLALWEALSKPGIEEKRLLYRLTTTIPALPQKLSASIATYPGIIERNFILNDLQILSDVVLENILPSPELEHIFLQECYAQSGALSQFSLASKQILEARYTSMFQENVQAR